MTNPFELFDQRLARIETVLAKIEHQKTNETPNDDFIGVQDAASFVDLKPSTIYKLISSRKIPFYKNGKRVYFKPSDLRQWIGAGRNLTIDELKNAV